LIISRGVGTSSTARIAEGALTIHPTTSSHPFRGGWVGGEGGSNSCRFSQSIPTIACPHPNPLPEGEGDFLG
ncbi:MAG TPA: hypothetical protein PL064_13030, partial [Thermogutta sp.]|nr:hypothetical protein [Thermogutta sp.]HQF12908.1 hypothetical protein [Thermogutta sp.]